ncbi:MAG TPA: hypothetical protein VFZ25_02695 [Chloroflexota bacterium]|nr:hypothetical protein [Chloroflexota bacterium]
MSLWESTDHQDWAGTLARYPEVIARQGVAKLPELDRWYREVLPGLIAAREPAYLTREELLRAVEWKMARGVWRGRNLALARSNSSETIEELSRDALRQIANGAPLNAPIATLSKLAGVGPATASAVVAAAAPAAYPFFDDLVAAQIPGFGAVDFTPKVYARYADALRERAHELGGDWTPTLVERALWSASGGKVALQTK